MCIGQHLHWGGRGLSIICIFLHFVQISATSYFLDTFDFSLSFPFLFKFKVFRYYVARAFFRDLFRKYALWANWSILKRFFVYDDFSFSFSSIANILFSLRDSPTKNRLWPHNLIQNKIIKFRFLQQSKNTKLIFHLTMGNVVTEKIRKRYTFL